MVDQSAPAYPLRPDFRYLHAPLRDELTATWTVGRAELAHTLADRIMLSRGGAFLVTGLRGVGKTTFVRLVIHLIETSKQRYAASLGDFQLVDVWINLARPMEPAQLMHHFIRHLYLRLREMKILDRLESELRTNLGTAFMRTSFEIASRSLLSEERSRGAEVGFSKAPWLGLEFLGKVSSSFKRTRTDEDNLKFLPFDEKAAELEILNLADRLAGGMHVAESWRRRLVRRLSRKPVSRLPIKVLFVLDELDKLEASGVSPETRSPLDSLLDAMKTVFSATDFSFVFIGGKDMQRRLTEDLARGDSVYESIFAYDLYLPCLWESQDQLLERCLETEAGAVARPAGDEFEMLKLYLQFKGRGVPRRTWRELNKHVVWADEHPVLTLDPERRRYMGVFSKIQGALSQEQFFGKRALQFEDAQFDSRRLRLYYAIDWIFSQGSEPFTVEKLQSQIRELKLSTGSKEEPSEDIAAKIVHMLDSRAFIEPVYRTVKADVASLPAANEYRLAAWVLRAFAVAAEKEWGGEESEPPWTSQAPPGLSSLGRYRVLAQIGQGGLATVYKVTDPGGRVLAAKVLHAHLTSEPAVYTRWEQEIETLKRLTHPSIARIYDSGVERDRAYFIMDFVEGISLRRVLDNQKVLRPDQAITIARELASAFVYVHNCGFVHSDIKPMNVIIQDDGRLKILDFGISTLISREGDTPSEFAEQVVGTPGYMAPEQALGKRLDARVDIFSLGVVLYEMLTGENPFQGTSTLDSIRRVVNEQPLPVSRLAPVSLELESVVMKALTKDPGDRFQSMQELEQALSVLAAPVPLTDIVRQARSANRQAAQSERSKTVIAPVPASSSVPDTVPPTPPPVSSPYEPPLTPPSPVAPPPLPVLSRSAPPPSATTPVPRGAQSDRRGDTSREPGAAAAAVPSVAAVASLEADTWDPMVALRDENPDVRQRAMQALGLSNPPGTLDLLFDFAQGVCFLTGSRLLSASLSRGRLILGRMSSVDLPLSSDGISRQHAAFFISQEGVEVEDLGSANGIVLNGVRCEREKLKDGDVLNLGALTVRVHLYQAARATVEQRSDTRV